MTASPLAGDCRKQYGKTGLGREVCCGGVLPVSPSTVYTSMPVPNAAPINARPEAPTTAPTAHSLVSVDVVGLRWVEPRRLPSTLTRVDGRHCDPPEDRR